MASEASQEAGLPIEELRSLSQLSSGAAAADLLGVWGSIGIAVWAAAELRSGWALASAAIFVGLRQGALANLAHDAWHRLCFPARSLNDAVGSWLYAYPIGLPYHHDRNRHLQHHRLVGRTDDPDWRNYRIALRESPLGLARYFAGSLAGGLLLETVRSFLGRGRLRIQVEPTGGEAAVAAPGPSPGAEMMRVVAVQALLAVGFTLAVGWWAYPVLWLLPLSTVCAFCVSVRAFVEHMAPSDQVTPEARLRDIAAGPVEHFVFSPCHFHFHALHHAHPSIPHFRLPAAKAALIATRGSYPFPVAPGYLRSLRRVFGALRHGRELAG